MSLSPTPSARPRSTLFDLELLQAQVAAEIAAYGTPAGVMKEWDERGRGRKAAPVFYHGTETDVLNQIAKEGLIPGKGQGGDAWAKKFAEEFYGRTPPAAMLRRAPMVYLSVDRTHAEMMAKMAAQLHPGSKPILLKVQFPAKADAGKLSPDEFSEPGKDWKWDGIIPPKYIKAYNAPSNHTALGNNIKWSPENSAQWKGWKKLAPRDVQAAEDKTFYTFVLYQPDLPLTKVGARAVRVRANELIIAHEYGLLTEGEPWVGVDLDGTLAQYDKWEGPDQIGAPIPQMVRIVKKHLEDGDTVKIFTARVSDDPKGVARKAIEEWCEKHFGQKLPVTCQKDHDMIMLYDDRAVAVEHNDGTLKNDPDEVGCVACESGDCVLHAFNPEEARDAHGRWSGGGGDSYERVSWQDTMRQNLDTMSSTAHGKGRGPDRPSLDKSGTALADRTKENFERACDWVWNNRNMKLTSADIVLGAVTHLGNIVNEGLLKKEQSPWRTWEDTAKGYTPVAQIQPELHKFAADLAGRMQSGGDPKGTAAFVEHEFNTRIHPLADGMGRTTMLLAAMTLLQNNHELPRYGDRATFYKGMTGPNWESHYRSLFPLSASEGAEWDEGKHPRDHRGRFADKGEADEGEAEPDSIWNAHRAGDHDQASRIEQVLQKADTDPRVKEVEQRIKDRGDCRNDPGVMKDGEYTPPAEMENERIALSFLNRDARVDESHRPLAIFLVGKPGSGKSTLIDSMIAQHTLPPLVKVDADKIQEQVPGYEPTLAACFHERACDVARKYLQPLLMMGRYNAAFDMTDNSNRLVETATDFKHHGYRVVLLHADVDTATSVEHAYDRFVKGGRYVPLNVVKSYGEKPRQAYQDLIDKGIADEWRTYDTSGPRTDPTGNSTSTITHKGGARSVLAGAERSVGGGAGTGNERGFSAHRQAEIREEVAAAFAPESTLEKIWALETIPKPEGHWSVLCKAKQKTYGKSVWKRNPITITKKPVDAEAFKMLPFKLRDRLVNKAPVMRFDPKELKSNQPAVYQADLEYFAKHGMNPDPAVVLKTSVGLFVHNGNHRAAVALLAGKQVKARYVDLYKVPEIAKRMRAAALTLEAKRTLDSTYDACAETISFDVNLLVKP